MQKIDYHLHTKHSFDSEGEMEAYIQKAISLGLTEICFTDHQDFCYPIDDFTLNVPAYHEEFLKLKAKYQDQISLKWGVEIGLDLDYQAEIEKFIATYPFDFVIGSIHVIKGTEFYYGKYFENRTKEEAHRFFFAETLRCVKAFNCFDVLGHLDYIQRYGPYADRTIDYRQYQDIIDEIFKTLIDKGKGIEVNCSGYKLFKDCGFPNYKLIKRYYDLGGRIITVGTDSHTSATVGTHLADVIKRLEDIGFTEFTRFKNRERDV